MEREIPSSTSFNPDKDIDLSPVNGVYQTPSRKKKRRRRKPLRPSPMEKILIAERRERVFQLRKNGFSLPAIQKKLIEEGYARTAIGTIHRDITMVLEDMKTRTALTAEDYLQMELSKLEDIEQVLLPRVNMTAAPEDVRSTILVMKQRDRLLNISEATKADINAKNALAKLLGVEPHLLPEPEKQIAPRRIAKRLED